MSYVVGPKGQVVISKDLRDLLGIEPGWIALQRLAGDHIEVYFVPPLHRKSLKGQLARHIRTHISQGPEWDDARQKAWKTAVKEENNSDKQIDA